MIENAYSEYPRAHTERSFSVLLLIAEVLKNFPGAYRFIGGWSPFILCRSHGTIGSHVGSRDIDVLLFPDRIPPKAYNTIVQALKDAGLKPDDGDENSFRWKLSGDQDSEEIVVEFLAPADRREDHNKNVLVGGLKAPCLYGTSAASAPPIVVRKKGLIWKLGTSLEVSLDFANGAAIVASKAIAFHDKRVLLENHKTLKHAYDIYYVITAYEAGSDALVREFRQIPDQRMRDEALAHLETNFISTGALGPRCVAAFLGDRLSNRQETERDVRQQVEVFVASVRR